jgi:hypothetical protein
MFNRLKIAKFRPQSTMQPYKPLPEPFNFINGDCLHEILLHLSWKDLWMLHSVSCSFRIRIALYLTCTILRISDNSEEEPDFSKFCEACQNLTHPFLYQITLSITWNQFSESNYEFHGFPILGIFTNCTNTLPPEFIADDAEKLSRFLAHAENLPALIALDIRDPRLTFQEMRQWEINTNLQYLEFSGFEKKLDTRTYFTNTNYRLINLKTLIATFRHPRCILHELPRSPNITRCVINLLPEMDEYLHRDPSTDLSYYISSTIKSHLNYGFSDFKNFDLNYSYKSLESL